MTWWNWCRTSPCASMPAGQCTTRPSRVPPKCDATCLVHWYGVFIASAQPTGYMRVGPRPPIRSTTRGDRLDVVGEAVTRPGARGACPRDRPRPRRRCRRGCRATSVSSSTPRSAGAGRRAARRGGRRARRRRRRPPSTAPRPVAPASDELVPVRHPGGPRGEHGVIRHEAELLLPGEGRARAARPSRARTRPRSGRSTPGRRGTARASHRGRGSRTTACRASARAASVTQSTAWSTRSSERW